MAGFSDYAELKVLEHLVGKTSWTMGTAYVGLYIAAPTDAGGGTRVTGSGYGSVATSGADWTSAASGTIGNANTIQFGTASGSWGTVVAFDISDNAGHMLAWGTLTTSKIIGTGDTASFAPGAFGITAD